MSRCRLFAVLLIAGQTGVASAENRPEEVRNYIFGNSLIHHLTDSATTTMPFWLSKLSEAGGKTYSVAGQWGFLGDFLQELPPIDQWQFAGVPDAWNKDVRPFEKAGFTTIIVNPANFIQYQPPHYPYHGDNPGKATPVEETVSLFEWLDRRQPGLDYFIYEGWADMHVFADPFPPDARQMADYQKFNMAGYHQWYRDYHERVQAKLPGLDIGLIPVGSVMAKLLTGPLKELSPEELYSDNSPHGTAATYFLAAMITYTKIYGEKVPHDMALPDRLPQPIRDKYPIIATDICEEILEQADC